MHLKIYMDQKEGNVKVQYITYYFYSSRITAMIVIVTINLKFLYILRTTMIVRTLH